MSRTAARASPGTTTTRRWWPALLSGGPARGFDLRRKVVHRRMNAADLAVFDAKQLGEIQPWQGATVRALRAGNAFEYGRAPTHASFHISKVVTIAHRGA